MLFHLLCCVYLPSYAGFGLLSCGFFAARHTLGALPLQPLAAALARFQDCTSARWPAARPRPAAYFTRRCPREFSLSTRYLGLLIACIARIIAGAAPPPAHFPASARPAIHRNTVRPRWRQPRPSSYCDNTPRFISSLWMTVSPSEYSTLPPQPSFRNSPVRAANPT